MAVVILNKAFAYLSKTPLRHRLVSAFQSGLEGLFLFGLVTIVTKDVFYASTIAGTIVIVRLLFHCLLNITRNVFVYLKKVCFPVLSWNFSHIQQINNKTFQSFFDEHFYLDSYSEVRKQRISPFRHFITIGLLKNYNPNIYFNSSYYLQVYPDVAASGMIPVIHYLLYGAAEGRNPSPLFNTSYYLTRYPDVVASSLNPLVHYLKIGALNGSYPAATIDVSENLGQVAVVKRIENMSIDNMLKTLSSPTTPSMATPNRLLFIDNPPLASDPESKVFHSLSLIRNFYSCGYMVTLAIPKSSGQIEGSLQGINNLGITVLYGRSNIFSHFQQFGCCYEHVILSGKDTIDEFLPLARAYALNAKVIYDTEDLRWSKIRQLFDQKEQAQSGISQRTELIDDNCVKMTFPNSDPKCQRPLDKGLDGRIANPPQHLALDSAQVNLILTKGGL